MTKKPLSAKRWKYLRLIAWEIILKMGNQLGVWISGGCLVEGGEEGGESILHRPQRVDIAIGSHATRPTDRPAARERVSTCPARRRCVARGGGRRARAAGLIVVGARPARPRGTRPATARDRIWAARRPPAQCYHRRRHRRRRPRRCRCRCCCRYWLLCDQQRRQLTARGPTLQVCCWVVSWFIVISTFLQTSEPIPGQ